MNINTPLAQPDYLMPLVLHKIVKDTPIAWDDISEDVFIKLIDVIGSSCVLIHQDQTPQTNGWCLTFDDGNVSDYEIVFPILRDRGIVGVFFLIAEKVGKDGYLNWSQIAEMSRNGMKFGSHSLSHRDMTSLAKKEVWAEFTHSKRLLEDKIGIEITSFSYPYGCCSKKLNRTCFAAGYKFSFTSNHGFANKNSSVIPRNSINSNMRWPDILSILEPKMSTRLRWYLEDSSKNLIKSLIGRERYIKLRDKMLYE